MREGGGKEERVCEIYILREREWGEGRGERKSERERMSESDENIVNNKELTPQNSNLLSGMMSISLQINYLQTDFTSARTCPTR